MSTEETLPAPSLLRRLAAMVYDTFLAFALLLASTCAVIGLRVALEGADSLDKGQPAISGAWEIPTFAFNLLVLATFFAYFWIKTGQTLGMQTWRLEVRDNTTEQRISWSQAYIRFAAALLSATVGGLGYLWVLIDKDRQAWHDKLSNSHLVLLPKPNKKD